MFENLIQTLLGHHPTKVLKHRTIGAFMVRRPAFTHALCFCFWVLGFLDSAPGWNGIRLLPFLTWIGNRFTIVAKQLG